MPRGSSPNLEDPKAPARRAARVRGAQAKQIRSRLSDLSACLFSRCFFRAGCPDPSLATCPLSLLSHMNYVKQRILSPAMAGSSCGVWGRPLLTEGLVTQESEGWRRPRETDENGLLAKGDDAFARRSGPPEIADGEKHRPAQAARPTDLAASGEDVSQTRRGPLMCDLAHRIHRETFVGFRSMRRVRRADPEPCATRLTAILPN
jgi:hypothetical protein